jgi:hypothetical protein
MTLPRFSEDMTTEDLMRISDPSGEPSYDREALESIYGKARKATGKETGRYDAAMKALVDPFLKAQRERIGRGVTPQKAAAIQALIGQIATSPSGALGGLLDPEKGMARTLEKLGEIDTAQAERESEFATTEFGIKEKDLTTKHQRTLDVIKSNKELELIFNGLPTKQKKDFLNRFTTVSGAYANWLKAKAALIAAQNKSLTKGDLKGPLAKKITELVGQGTGISATLNEEGNLVTLDGETLTTDDAQKLGRFQSKFIGIYTKIRKTVDTDLEAAYLAYEKIWGKKPDISDDIGITVDVNEQEPNTVGNKIPLFTNPRKKLQ